MHLRESNYATARDSCVADACDRDEAAAPDSRDANEHY